MLNVCSFLVTLAALDLAIIVSASQPSQQSEAIAHALQSGGLRAAARVAGHYETYHTTQSEALADDLTELQSISDSIVVARVKGRLSSALSPSGDSISTDYGLEVDESIRGRLHASAVFRLRLPGGAVVFEDGTTATVRTDDLERIVPGRRYVLFLKDLSDHELLSLGLQSAFGFKADEATIDPLAATDTPIVIRYRGSLSGMFLQSVRFIANQKR